MIHHVHAGLATNPCERKIARFSGHNARMTESLRSHLLIASPRLADYFRRTVVLVLEHNDENIGYVRDLLIDEVDWKVCFLHATWGGFMGLDELHFLIPIEAVSYVGGGFVKTELSKEQVHGGPKLDPNIRLHPELRAEIYEYYGYPPPE